VLPYLPRRGNLSGAPLAAAAHARAVPDYRFSSAPKSARAMFGRPNGRPHRQTTALKAYRDCKGWASAIFSPLSDA